MPLEPAELFPEVPNLYEFPSVHRDMVFDEQRVTAYWRAIESTVRPGDVVVDVGTGTGLLSFLCLKAGASRVHAIERSPIIDAARQIAKVNGFEDRIAFYQEDSRDTQIAEPADIMVSELIGHIAFEEGMAESLIDARSRFLKADGSMIPQAVMLNAAPVNEPLVYESCISGWDRAYGIDFSPMRHRALSTSYIVDITERDLMADYASVLSVSLKDGGCPESHCERSFEVYRTGEVNGVALWFDAILSDHIRLSSGPWSKTHWQQCFAPIPTPIRVKRGDKLKVSIDMKLRTRDNDHFVFSVQIESEENVARANTSQDAPKAIAETAFCQR